MTSKHDKIRSLILAALMVFSVFAGTVAFSGAATAANASDADATLTDGSTFWQGQELYYSDTAISAGETVEIRNTEDNGLVKQVTADDVGDLMIDTSSLGEGTYYLEEDDNNTRLADFEVAKQTVTADFTSDSAENDGPATLSLDSNRGKYPLTISATHDGSAISEDKLASMIDGASTGDNDDDKVTLSKAARSEISVNFNGEKTGNYTFTVSASDTTASDTASVDVTDAAEKDVEFTQSTFETSQGDVAALSVEFTGDANVAYVQVGEKSESGYEAVVKVTDADADGEATVLFNTYAAGQNNNTTLVDSEEDTVSVVSGNNNLDNILEQGDYPLAVALNQGEIGSPDDVATLYINERSTDSANVWTAPGGTSTSDMENLDAQLTEASSIAQGDWVVLEFSATGIGGLIEAEGGLQSAISADNGLNVSVKQTEATTPKNTDPKELDLSGAAYVADTDNGTYHVAIKTDSLQYQDGSSVAAGDEFNASFIVSNSQLTDGGETVSTNFEIAESTVEIDEPVNVTATEGQSITGTSTLAPGSEFQVRIESTGDTQPRFFESATATVQDDGTWSVSFDRFAEQSVGDTFDVTVTAAGGDSAEGNVVEETTETTTTGTTETPTTTTDGTPTASPTDDGEGDGTPTPSEEPTDTTTPGFGVAVALVALLAAALLAVRRD